MWFLCDFSSDFDLSGPAWPPPLNHLWRGHWMGAKIAILSVKTHFAHFSWWCLLCLAINQSVQVLLFLLSFTKNGWQRVTYWVNSILPPLCVLINLCFAALKKCVFACACLCVCVRSLDKIETHQDPGKLLPFHPLMTFVVKDPLALALSLSLLLSHWDGLDHLALPGFEVFWGGVRSSASVPLAPLLCPFASVAGVALPLCANSALIQKLFYAVNRTCDRQRGGKERSGEEGGVGWGQDNTF